MDALPGIALVVVCAIALALIIKRADHNNALAAQRKLALAADEAAKPMPTDLELMHSWMEGLAKKVHEDARSRQTSFQWFLFALPAIYALTYGIAWGILYTVLH